VDEQVIPRPHLSGLAPLRYSAYARLWTGAFVSNIGTWMESVALGIYVDHLTHSAAWVGTVAAAAFVPIAFFGPVGGALADRFPRKWLLVVTSLVQTALAGLLAYLLFTGEPSAPTITLIALGNGICAALSFPSYQAVLPDLVPTEVIPGAVALSSAQYNLGRVIGPALAGIVIGTDRFAAAEAINALSFLAVVAVVLTLALPAPEPHARDTGMFRSIVLGFRFVRREPGLWVNIRAMCLNTFLAAPFIALVPAMAIEVLHASYGTAVLVTAQGIGAVAMAFMLGPLVARFRARTVLVAMIALLPPALAAYAIAPDLALSAVAILFLGAVYLGALSSFTTIAQLRAPASIRGRVLSVHTVVLGALYPIGAVIQGWIADSIGLRATTFAAALTMAVVLIAVRLASPGFTRAIDKPVELTSPA
jgi:MFS family permease